MSSNRTETQAFLYLDGQKEFTNARIMLMFDDEPDFVTSELSSISGSYQELLPIKKIIPEIKSDKDTPDIPIVLDNFGDLNNLTP